MIRTASPPAALSQPPKLDAVVDLGALPLPAQGQLSDADSDGKMSSGEWIALRGSGLSGAAVSVDGQAVTVQGYLEDGLLVRWPTGLLPKASHEVQVKTASGVDAAKASSISYLVGSDTTAGQVRFLRVVPGAKKFVDRSRETVPLERALYHAHSADGGLLYALGISGLREEGGRPVFECALKVIHLGAKQRPKAIKTITLTTQGQPAALSVDANHAVILSSGALEVLSLKDPLAPAPAGRIELPRTTERTRYVALDFVGPSKVAVLDAYENRVQLISLEGTALGPSFPVGPSGVAASLDLVAREDAVWVLQGPSLRGATEKLGGLIGLKRPEESPAKVSSRLVKVPLSGGANQPIALPEDVVPLFLAKDGQGGFLVSGVHGELLDFAKVDASLDGAGRVLGWLKDSFQLGRVLRISKEGQVQTALRGVSVFLHVSALADGRVLYSGMRLGARLSAPFVGVNWGIGVEGVGHVSLRKLGYKFLLPPYAYGDVSSGP